MRLFKPKYKDRKGQTKTVSKWWIELRDHHRIVRRFPAFTDKGESRKFGEKVEKLIVYRQNNEPPSRELSEWLEVIPAKLRDRFGEIGLLDRSRVAAGKQISEHLEDFRKSIQAGNTEMHVRITCSRIKRVFDGCGFNYWSDIQASEVKEFLTSLDISNKTFNYYLTAVRQFCRWMVRDRRASESPVEYLERLSVPDTECRRALSYEEVCKLIVATEKAPVRFGMTGHERAVLYLLAIECGLRVRELQNLKVKSFDFQEKTVTLGPEFCKDRKQAVQLLKQKRAVSLRKFFADKNLEDRAFEMPSHYRTAKMLHAECQDANIHIVDEAGRKIVFHSLRHTLATALDQTGASLRERMHIMRHSEKSNLTLGVYTHIETYNLRRAIEKLPDYPWPGD